MRLCKHFVAPALIMTATAGAASVGCSGSGSETAVSTPAPATTAATADPMAEVAEQFLQAVVAGDTPRATSLLTLEAQTQFAASGQGFASPEIGAPSFRIGQVRKVDPDRGAVQCLLVDGEGEAEMCCLLKRGVQGWRVSGVAYDTGSGQPPVIINFEAPERLAPVRKPPTHFAEGRPGNEPPVQTASEAPAELIR